jgi:hypothetical protein
MLESQSSLRTAEIKTPSTISSSTTVLEQVLLSVILHREGDDSQALRNRADAITEYLRKDFFVGVQPRNIMASIYIWSILRLASFTFLSSPVVLFRILAKVYDLQYESTTTIYT